MKLPTGGAERSKSHVFPAVHGASTTFALALTHRARPCFTPTFLFARLYASHGLAGRAASAICTDKLLASWTEMQHTAHGDNRLRNLSYMDVAINRRTLSQTATDKRQRPDCRCDPTIFPQTSQEAGAGEAVCFWLMKQRGAPKYLAIRLEHCCLTRLTSRTPALKQGSGPSGIAQLPEVPEGRGLCDGAACTTLPVLDV